MPIPTLGDLAQSYVQRTQISRVNNELSTLAKELSTGLLTDIPGAMRGDTQQIAAINRGLTALDSHDFAANETAFVLDFTEKAIDTSRSRLSGLFELSATVLQSSDATQVNAIAARAREDFEAMLGDLNSEAGGMSLFAGTATDRPALRGADAIFADIAAAAAGATTAQDVRNAIDTYFQPGGAFDTNDYLGSDTARGATRVGPNDSVDFAPRAGDPAFREGLKALAHYAVIDAGVLGGQPDERLALMASERVSVLNAERGLVALQADAGAAKSRLETAQTRNAAERQGLETARLGFVAADPFETASRLKDTELQLETLYTVTARLSRLNLTNYL